MDVVSEGLQIPHPGELAFYVEGGAVGGYDHPVDPRIGGCYVYVGYVQARTVEDPGGIEMLDVHEKPVRKLDLPVGLREPARLVEAAGGEIFYRPLPEQDLGVGESLPSILI